MSSEASALRTSPSLLRRLHDQPDNASAWAAFVERYRPLLAGWCRHWGLQEADVEDVAQQVLLRLAVKLRQFVYDPTQSFRGWLRTLTRHAWADFVANRRRQGQVAYGGISSLLEAPARDDLEARLAELFDLELLEEANARVRQRVADKTWDAFHRTAVLGQAGAEVAIALGMPVVSVFKAKSNVLKLLQEEIRILEKEGTDEGVPQRTGDL